MAEFLLTEVEEFAGANARGPWLKYTLKDSQGQGVATTFDSTLGILAKNLVGSPVSITTKPASDPRFAPTLLTIEASANGSFTPPPEPHHAPVLGGDKDRAISRLACLKAAAELLAPRTASSVHPDYDPALEAMKAASRFETWVYRDIDEPPFQ